MNELAIPGDQAEYGTPPPNNKAKLGRSGLIKACYLSEFRMLFLVRLG